MEVRWGLVAGALGLFGLSLFAFKKPHLFLDGKRSKFWVGVLGKERAVLMVKYVSVPLVALVALFLFIGGVGVIHLK